MKVTVAYGQKRSGPEKFTTDSLDVVFEETVPEGVSSTEFADRLFSHARSWVENNLPKYEAPKPSSKVHAPQTVSSPPSEPPTEKGNWEDNLGRICKYLGVSVTDEDGRKRLDTQIVRHLSKWKSKDGRWVSNLSKGYRDWIARGRNKAGEPQTPQSIARVNEGIVTIGKVLECGDRVDICYNLWNRDTSTMDWKKDTLVPREPYSPDPGQPTSEYPGEESFPPDQGQAQPSESPLGGGIPDDIPF